MFYTGVEKLKVIIYGSPIQSEYLESLLAGAGVKILKITVGPAIQKLLDTTLSLSEVVLALIDPREKDAEILLDRLCRLKIPVVLLLDESYKDWDNLFQMNVCGYLQTNQGVCVLSAHLKALLRRFDSSGALVDQLVNSAFDARNGLD